MGICFSLASPMSLFSPPTVPCHHFLSMVAAAALYEGAVPEFSRIASSPSFFVLPF